VGDQRPLIGRLLGAQRVVGGEDPRELRGEGTLRGEPGEDRAEPAAQQLLAERRPRQMEEHAAVEEQCPGEVDL
jgi:hypothetical protein